MQPASAEGSNSDTGRALRRYGPIAAIAVVALVVIGVVIAGGGDDAAAPVDTDAGDRAGRHGHDGCNERRRNDRR